MDRYVDKLTETERRYITEEIERIYSEMLKKAEEQKKEDTEKREREEKERQKKEALLRKYAQYINKQARIKFQVKMHRIQTAQSQNSCDDPLASTSSASTSEPPNCPHNSQPPPDKDYLRYLETDLGIFNEALFANADRIADEYFSSLQSEQTPSTSKRSL